MVIRVMNSASLKNAIGMPKEKNQLLQVPCTAELKDRLLKYCGRSGRKESDVVVEAVTHFLDNPVVRPHPSYFQLMKEVGNTPPQAKPLVPRAETED